MKTWPAGSCSCRPCHVCLNNTVLTWYIQPQDSPDCRMATQLSWDEDMASRVLLMSSLSCVPSMDNRLYTISTCRNGNNSSNMCSYVNTYTLIINQPAVLETLCGKRDNLPIQGSQIWPRHAHVIVWWFGHGMTSTIHLPSTSDSSEAVIGYT